MKKVFGIAFLLLAFAACNKTETESQPVEKAEGIPFSATVSLGNNAATKALTEDGNTINAAWAAGETVALIHNGVTDEMTVSSVSSDGNATITGTITGTPSDDDPVTIIYPSSAADGTTGNIKADLLYAQNGLLTGEGSIAEKYDARKGTGTLKVGSTATLSGNVSLTNQFAIFKFTVRGADGATVISAKPLTITIGTQDYVITPAEATDVLYAALPAVSGQKVSFNATDGSDRTYTCAKLSVSFDAGKYYQSTLKMREYVDLGTGIKWATCNVGAANPQDYGDYFAWGETSGYNSGKTNFAWGTYDVDSKDGNTFTEYYNSGGKTVLDLKNDAANQNWGGSWRMPTQAEMIALCNLSKVRTTHEGIAGAKFTGGNGKTLFLPAAGYRPDSRLDYAGTGGYYWSSSLGGNDSDACYVGLSQWAWVVASVSSSHRCYGQSVRPVTE